MNVGSEWLDFSPILCFAHALGVIWISNNLPDTLKTHVYPETARVFHDHMKYWWFYVCNDYWMVVVPADSLLQSTWTNAFWKEKVFTLKRSLRNETYSVPKTHLNRATSFWYLLKWIWCRMYQILVFLYNTWLCFHTIQYNQILVFPYNTWFQWFCSCVCV